MKEVRWTQTAIKSLHETSDFILEIWNSEIQQDFIELLDFRISQLQSNPLIGLAFEDSDIRKLTVHKTVSLFYSHNQNMIKLLLVWDNRQDPDELLEKLKNTTK